MKHQLEQLRFDILKRDNNECQCCFIKNKPLDIHHIIPKKFGGLDIANNLVALCRKCHRLVEKWGKRYG